MYPGNGNGNGEDTPTDHLHDNAPAETSGGRGLLDLREIAKRAAEEMHDGRISNIERDQADIKSAIGSFRAASDSRYGAIGNSLQGIHDAQRVTNARLDDLARWAARRHVDAMEAIGALSDALQRDALTDALRSQFFAAKIDAARAADEALGAQLGAVAADAGTARAMAASIPDLAARTQAIEVAHHGWLATGRALGAWAKSNRIWIVGVLAAALGAVAKHFLGH